MFPRLYAILDVDIAHARHLDAVALADVWLSAGVRLFQLRAKTMAAGPMFDLACVLVDKARAAGATFIVNDRVDVAAMSGADGVHVGQDDLPPADARRLMPAPALVGVSTHNDAQVQAAVREPVSYVAIGPVFGTVSKANPDPVVGLEGVRLAHAQTAGVGLPLVAIGGITLERAPRVIEAGASSLAVISDLLDAHPAERVRAFLRAIR